MSSSSVNVTDDEHSCDPAQVSQLNTLPGYISYIQLTVDMIDSFCNQCAPLPGSTVSNEFIAIPVSSNHSLQAQMLSFLPSQTKTKLYEFQFLLKGRLLPHGFISTLQCIHFDSNHMLAGGQLHVWKARRRCAIYKLLTTVQTAPGPTPFLSFRTGLLRPKMPCAQRRNPVHAQVATALCHVQSATFYASLVRPRDLVVPFH